MLEYSNMTIVATISPIPETKPGISVFSIIAFRSIPFRYWRSFVPPSCHVRTTTPTSETLSQAGNIVLIYLFLMVPLACWRVARFAFRTISPARVDTIS